MPAPDVTTWLKQASAAVVTVLKASPDFMSASAGSPPVGAAGLILRVDDHDKFEPLQPKDGNLYCAVFTNGFVDGGGTVIQQSPVIDVVVSIFGETSVGQKQQKRVKRPTLWQNAWQASSVLTKVVAQQVNGTGGAFGSYCQRASHHKADAYEEWDKADDYYEVTVENIIRMWVRMNAQ